jgi:hypothetical protein
MFFPSAGKRTDHVAIGTDIKSLTPTQLKVGSVRNPASAVSESYPWTTLISFVGGLLMAGASKRDQGANSGVLRGNHFSFDINMTSGA